MSGSSGGVTSPQAQMTPRDTATGTFANMLNAALTSGNNLGELLRQIGQTAGYTGPVNAPINAGQSNALAAANASFARLFGMNNPGTGNQPAGPSGGLAGLPGGPAATDFWSQWTGPKPNQGTWGAPIPSNTLQNPGAAFQDQTPVTVNGKQTTVADYMKAINTPGTPEFAAFSPPGYSFYNGAWVNDSTLEMAGLKQPGVPLPPPTGSPSASLTQLPGSPQVGSTASSLTPQLTNGLQAMSALDPNSLGGVSASNTSTQIAPPNNPGPGGLGTPMQLPGSTTPAAGGPAPVGPVTGIGAMPGQGSDANLGRIASMTGLNLPPQLQALINGAQSQQGGMANAVQTQVATGVPYLDALASLGTNGGGSSTGSNYLQTLLQDPAARRLLNGGQSTDLNTIGSAISAAAQPGLDRNIRDLREQFSTMGLRDGTDINSGVSDLMARNQSQITGQLAQIAPQLMQNANSTSLGALSSLGSIGSNLGSLGQGDLSARIAALTGAASTGTQAQGQNLNALNQLLGTTTSGNSNVLGTLSGLFGNQQNNTTAAALAQPGATATLAQLPGQLAAQNYGLNAQSQTLDQTALDRNMAVWLQQQGLTPQLLSFFGTTPPTQYGPSPLSQGTNALGTALAAYSAAKGSK